MNKHWIPVDNNVKEICNSDSSDLVKIVKCCHEYWKPFNKVDRALLSSAADPEKGEYRLIDPVLLTSKYMGYAAAASIIIKTLVNYFS
jgi:hypothetical protein